MAIEGLELYENLQNFGYKKAKDLKKHPKHVTKRLITISNDLRDRSMNAEKIVIDKSVLEFAVNEIMARPTELLHMYEHITIPFDSIWVEYDALAYNQHRLDKGFTDPENTTAHIDREAILVTGKAFDQTAPIKIEPISYELGCAFSSMMYYEVRPRTKSNIPPNALDDLDVKGYPKELWSGQLSWGSHFQRNWHDDPNEKIAVEKLDALVHAKAYDCFVNYIRNNYKIGPIDYGLLMKAIPIIHLLNYDPVFNVTTSSGETTRRMTSTGKPIVDTITARRMSLTIPVHRAITRVRRLSAARKPKALHEVRGTYAYSRKRTDFRCHHVWVDTGRNTQQECVRCKGLRWIRKPHLRGDAKYGTRLHSHTIVTA